MKIISFVGTSLEIIKSLVFTQVAEELGVEFEVAHTGQNRGERMSTGFFEELGIPFHNKSEVVRDAWIGRLGSTMPAEDHLWRWCDACPREPADEPE